MPSLSVVSPRARLTSQREVSGRKSAALAGKWVWAESSQTDKRSVASKAAFNLFSKVWLSSACKRASITWMWTHDVHAECQHDLHRLFWRFGSELKHVLETPGSIHHQKVGFFRFNGERVRDATRKRDERAGFAE